MSNPKDHRSSCQTSRKSPTASQRAKRRVLLTLVILGVLLLPIIAYALGAYVFARGGAVPEAAHLLNSVVLLVFTAFLVAAVGGLLVWGTVTSLARTTEVEARRERLDEGFAERLEQHSPLMNSVTRMLSTIERQTTELSGFADRLERANRELESANARLQEVTFTDELTSLYNRRFLSVRLKEEVARHGRFGHALSLVLLDVDRFRALNEDLGHVAGNETLRRVADLLVKSSRAIDAVCRYGGDEFALLLAETSRAGARSHAARILDVLCTSSFSHGRLVTASFGVACLPEHGATADDLVRAADEALCLAKRSGKNRVVICAERGTVRLAEWESPPE